MNFNGVKMKRIILVLLFLLTACSQETSLTSQPIVITETPQATLPPAVVEEVTYHPGYRPSTRFCASSWTCDHGRAWRQLNPGRR